MFMIAALVTFTAIVLLLTNLGAHNVRRVVGYTGWADLVVHGTIIFLFIDSSTLGLLQAEAAGILFSFWLRYYRWAWGYERLVRNGSKMQWVRYAGRFT